MVFDGNKMVCYLGTEPVFTWRLSSSYVAHTTWLINKVGILSDTNDVSTVFDNFVAKSA
jgi:hypothetical protein